MTMDVATIAMVAATISLCVTVVDKIWLGSWNLSSEMAKMEKRLTASIVTAKQEIEERQDEHIEQVGTTLTSFRDKFREIELYIRDNYVKGPDFVSTLQKHTDLQKAYQSAVIDRLDRVEKKLDAKTH